MRNLSLLVFLLVITGSGFYAVEPSEPPGTPEQSAVAPLQTRPEPADNNMLLFTVLAIIVVVIAAYYLFRANPKPARHIVKKAVMHPRKRIGPEPLERSRKKPKTRKLPKRNVGPEALEKPRRKKRAVKKRGS